MTDWIIAGSAVATLIATIVIIVVYYQLLQETRHQVAESRAQTRLAVDAQYDRYRPLLYPTGTIPLIDERHVDWRRGPWGVDLQNAGAGVAVAICGVFFGPRPAQPLASLPERYTLWRERPLRPDEGVRTVTMEYGKTQLRGDETIASYTLHAPPEPSLPQMQAGAPWIVARLTLTYGDIFGRNHASVSDYHDLYGWQPIAFLADIPDDLIDLDRRMRP